MSLLPDKKTVPKQNFHEYMKVYYGEPSMGKTSTAAQNDDAVFIMFEDGIAGLSVYAVNIPRIAKKQGKSRWDVFLDVVDELLNSDHNFNEVVIDTADRAIDSCATYTERETGLSDLAKGDWGSGWRKLFQYFKEPLERLQMSELGLTVISHADMKEVTDIKGRARDKIVPSITGKSGQWLIDESDIVILFDKDEDNNRIMRVESTKNFDAKQRLKFPDGDISMGKDETEAYKNLVKNFKKAVKNRNKELGVTEEQIKEYYEAQEEFKNKKDFQQIVDEIIEQCGRLGISQMDNAKAINKEYGAKSLKDLTYPQAEQYLEELKSK